MCQVFMWELPGLVNLSAGAGRIGQEMADSRSGWDWSKVSAGVSGIGPEFRLIYAEFMGKICQEYFL